jgi:isopenicillin-N N-acyltransferase like protein
MAFRMLACVALVATAGPALAQAPAQFPAATHKAGALKYVAGVPVVTVRGSPAEIGEQFGTLAGRNAPALNDLHAQFLKDAKIEAGYDGLMILAKRLKSNIPADYLAEMTAAAGVGMNLDMLIFAATIYDLSSGMGCSTVVVEPSRSATKQPIFGRNFDWLATQGIHEHTLVAVFRPTGKRAFATVTVSPITGCISGMNDAGLCCTINEIHLNQSKERATMNWAGVPMLFAFRQVLEQCRTVAEAEALLRKTPRTTTACLTICDAAGGAVFEMTPKTLVVKPPVRGIGLCTNHFCTEALGLPTPCSRMKKLLALQSSDATLGVDQVFAQLHDVNQGQATLQSMVFEPAARKLHLKLAKPKGTATTEKPTTLDLGDLLRE